MRNRIALVIIWSIRNVRAIFVIILQDSIIIASSTRTIVVWIEVRFDLY